MADFEIKPEFVNFIRWSKRGSCGNLGCADPECSCSLCGKAIGVSEEDPRWDSHDENCYECDLCRDRIPIMMWRGDGKDCEQAQFHLQCFQAIVVWQSGGFRATR